MDLLYKYRAFDTERDCARTLQILQEGKVWLATPSSFNDPFDCQPSILRNSETDQRNGARIVRNYLAKIKSALRTSSTLADRECQPIPHRTLVNVKQVLQSRRTNEQKYNLLKKYFVVPPNGAIVFESLRRTLDRIGVLSLSTDPIEMLMWAHYASQHTGICLGFERSEGSLLKNSIHTKPVNYVDKYPEIELDSLEVNFSISFQDRSISDFVEIDIEDPNLQAVMYSKSTAWRHEKEWRMLVDKGGVPANYPGPLREVIFGLRCKEESRSLIKNAITEMSPTRTIQFGEIQSAPGSFDLRICNLQNF